jgi:hypothetical protein
VVLAVMSDPLPLEVQKSTAPDGVRFWLALSPGRVPPLDRALIRAGHELTGSLFELVLLRLSEVGDPEWASELDFDSEAESCTVHCARRPPLVHLARRLARRLAEPARLRRLARSLPEST